MAAKKKKAARGEVQRAAFATKVKAAKRRVAARGATKTAARNVAQRAAARRGATPARKAATNRGTST